MSTYGLNFPKINGSFFARKFNRFSKLTEMGGRKA